MTTWRQLVFVPVGTQLHIYSAKSTKELIRKVDVGFPIYSRVVVKDRKLYCTDSKSVHEFELKDVLGYKTETF